MPSRIASRLAPALLSVLAGLALISFGPGARMARAVLPHVPEVSDPAGIVALPFILPSVSSEWSVERASNDPAFLRFADMSGGRWQARWDRRTGQLSALSGEGVPWVEPGLRVTGTPGASKTVSREQFVALLERRARAFVAEHPDLVAIPAGVTLEVDELRSGPLDGGRIWHLTLGASVGGVPVSGAFIAFGGNSGRLVQVARDGITSDIGSRSPVPSITREGAHVAAKSAVAALEGGADRAVAAEPVAAPALSFVPWPAGSPREFEGTPGQGLSHRLAWTSVWRLHGRIETWTVVQDARDGKVIALHDANKYACPTPASPRGRVTGGVYLGAIEEVPESLRGMPYALVSNGGDISADYNGSYGFTPGLSASTSLSGSYFDMTCAGCGAQAGAETFSFGNLALGIGGPDATSNGYSTRAERNCFYHLNVVRQLAAKHLTDADVNGYLNRSTPAAVNIASACNAFFDGTGVNFFRSGGGCNNTGEIADVMQHEWGHGLDQFSGGGSDGARGEGLSDVVAWLSTHDARLGPYFVVGNSAGIRNADENVSGLRSVANIDSQCPADGGGGGGPLGYQVHCEGGIFSQAWWHLARNLRAKYGEEAGWHATEKLFFQSLRGSQTYVPGGAQPTYDAVMLVDDDNGNLADGTPNAAEINEAFSHHGMAGTPLIADSAECTPPPAPALTVTAAQQPSTGLFQAHVSWPAVAGAVQYVVVRNDAGPGADVLAGIVFPPTTEFFDDNLTDGATYAYRVRVFDSAGCASVADNRQSVTTAAAVSFALTDYSVDDSDPVRANFNGIPEPGERVRVGLSAWNSGSVAATGVTVTLSTAHAGVTVTPPTLALPDMPANATAGTVAPHFAVQLDSALVACGERILFVVEIESAQGCSVAGFELLVGTVAPSSALFADDFESDRGWTVNFDGTDTASAGRWVRADPLGTAGGIQPEDDITPAPGVACLVTGNSNADLGNPGQDDVDGGCTTVRSPLYNAGVQSGLTLSYWRYFHISTSLDDQFVAELSNDGGGNWLRLETLAAPAPFERVTFVLDDVLGEPADRLVLRFRVCDTGAGSLIEALVDEVEIGRNSFACEPAAPRPRLRVDAFALRDDAASGAIGNGNGAIDPGETVRVAFDLANFGNATATAIGASLSLVTPPVGISLVDANGAWADIVPGASGRNMAAPADFGIQVDASVACGASFDSVLTVTYSGPAGTYSVQAPFTFGVGAVIESDVFFDDFEGDDNGFRSDATQGCINQNPFCNDWHHDRPTTSSAFDPPTARSGSRVWGNDLGDQQNGGPPFNGNYANDVFNWLESPALDLSGVTGARLSFWRWLTVEEGEFDRARILVNGTVIWSNPIAGNLLDSAWTYQEFDISAIADNDPSVRIRFELETDGGLTFGGWTLDDFRVFTRERQCVSANCINPPVPTSTGSALRATGRKDESGAEFAWPSLSIGPTETYRLWRGTDPTTLPVQVTPPGFAGASFDDRNAPGPLYFYNLVVANCAGAEGN